jgi:hypothetical protein
LTEGRLAKFATLHHTTGECLGIHVPKRGARFEALEPVRRAVQEQFGSVAENLACAVRLGHDDGSQLFT